MASIASLKSLAENTDVQDPWEDLQIDEQDNKKGVREYVERFSNINAICHTAQRDNFQSNMTSPQLLEAVIKLEKKSFHKNNFVCSICFDFFESFDQMQLHKSSHENTLAKRNNSVKH
jgi:hypothetical protein